MCREVKNVHSGKDCGDEGCDINIIVLEDVGYIVWYLVDEPIVVIKYTV